MKHRLTFVARRADATPRRAIGGVQIGRVEVVTGASLATAVRAAGLPLATGCSVRVVARRIAEAD